MSCCIMMIMMEGSHAEVHAGEAGVNWTRLEVRAEGDGLRIGGHDVWGAEWRRVQDDIQLRQPGTGKLGQYSVYEVGPEDAPVRFAIKEITAGMYSFYVPE